ncbi:zf-HC2 domain-containing protein [Streptomyces similanensis]|uniref:Zinc-finger domain-containing protein n=1 Tax=Streptomyces similanensis TaxID=1274988 RepID=A0ABP9K0C8_9ACTN
MTSTTDTAGHPDVTEISDLTEGLLTTARAEELRRHLDGCVPCADVHAALEEIRSLLGTSHGSQEAMPDDIADRIDAALAAEAGDGTHVSRETAALDRPAGRARTPSTGPGRKNRAPRGRRRIAVLGTAFTVAALGVASVVVVSLHDDQDAGTTAHGRPSAAADTFSEGALPQQVSGLLAKATQNSPNPAHPPHSFGLESDKGSGKPHVLKSEPTVPLPSCVQQGLNSAESPLAAKAGIYDGKDAYLVVLPDAEGDPTRVTAYLVDATCVRHPSVAAKVLLNRSYPRS